MAHFTDTEALPSKDIIRTITDDFDLDKIAASGQCFRWTKVSGTDEPLTYRIIAGRKCLYLADLGGGEFAFECSEEDFEGFWRGYFDLEEDYSAIRARIDPQKEPFLHAAAEYEKGIRILRQDTWETLITFIISQNRNIPAIRRSVELLAETCGELLTDCRGQEYHAFPEPDMVAELTDEQLDDCRLGYRCKYVAAAAKSVRDGEIDLKALADADESTTIKALTALYGVGKKVASCVSLFGLHHVDAFPVDVWMERILAQEYPDGYPFESGTPFNGVYQQYMFAYYRHQNRVK